jgi:hypothetical protein
VIYLGIYLGRYFTCFSLNRMLVFHFELNNAINAFVRSLCICIHLVLKYDSVEIVFRPLTFDIYSFPVALCEENMERFPTALTFSTTALYQYCLYFWFCFIGVFTGFHQFVNKCDQFLFFFTAKFL